MGGGTMSISTVVRWMLAVGVLVTGACREDTRREAKEAAHEVVEEVADGARDAKRTANAVAEQVHDVATNAIEEARQAADQLKDDAKPYVKMAAESARKAGGALKQKASQAASDVIEKGKEVLDGVKGNDEVTGGTSIDQPIPPPASQPADANTGGA